MNAAEVMPRGLNSSPPPAWAEACEGTASDISVIDSIAREELRLSSSFFMIVFYVRICIYVDWTVVIDNGKVRAKPPGGL